MHGDDDGTQQQETNSSLLQSAGLVFFFFFILSCLLSNRLSCKNHGSLYDPIIDRGSKLTGPSKSYIGLPWRQLCFFFFFLSFSSFLSPYSCLSHNRVRPFSMVKMPMHLVFLGGKWEQCQKSMKVVVLQRMDQNSR